MLVSMYVDMDMDTYMHMDIDMFMRTYNPLQMNTVFQFLYRPTLLTLITYKIPSPQLSLSPPTMSPDAADAADAADAEQKGPPPLILIFVLLVVVTVKPSLVISRICRMKSSG